MTYSLGWAGQTESSSDATSSRSPGVFSSGARDPARSVFAAGGCLSFTDTVEAGATNGGAGDPCEDPPSAEVRRVSGCRISGEGTKKKGETTTPCTFTDASSRSPRAFLQRGEGSRVQRLRSRHVHPSQTEPKPLRYKRR